MTQIGKKWLKYHYISVECWQNNHLRLCWLYLNYFLIILGDIWCVLELYSRAINVSKYAVQNRFKPVSHSSQNFVKSYKLELRLIKTSGELELQSS